MMTVDERIQRAGDRLAARHVAVPDLRRVLRRRRWIRGIAASGAVAALVAGGSVWAWPEGSRSRVETGVADDVVSGYELELRGAEVVGDETWTAGNTDVALWGDDAHQTYVTLTVRPGLAEAQPEPSALGPMREDSGFPRTQGRAWFSDVDDRQVRSITLWWARADGDLWLFRAYWYGADEVSGTDARTALRDWALRTESAPTSAGGTRYTITDSSLEPVAFDPAADDLPSRARVWRWRGHEITLLAIERSVAAGRSNLLAHGIPEPVNIDGHDGRMVRSASPAATVIAWQLDTPASTWVTLTIPHQLTNQTEDIIAALRQRPP